ncbi:MAG: LLM class flavin-dependent oxidoreductase [Chloroflexi bacterium]|nr:LLM class flavin-dependent oxidoreductase [Chloroflexota bacterium]
MKFVLFTHVPWPESEPPARLLAECAEQAALSEQLGFHIFWIAEHHFSRYSLGSSSLVLAAAIAARTEHIRRPISAT